MILDLPLRSTAPELADRYRADGLWRDQSFGDFFAEHLDRCADLPVRIWSRVHPYSGTVADLHAQARRCAAGLGALGVGPGDVVGYQLSNRVETLVTLYGAALAGATLVPIVHFYGPHEVRFILDQVGARIHITAAEFGSVDYRETIRVVRAEVPGVEHVVLVGDETVPGTRPFADLLDAAPLAELPAVDPDAPALIGFTSGTTAEPKGVIHSGNTIGAEIEQLRRYEVGASRPLLTGAPLAHAIGLTSGAVLPLVRHHPLHIIDRWEPAWVLEIMQEADVTSGSGATFFLTSLLDTPGFDARHAELMESVGLGGSPVPGAVCDRAEALGIRTTRCYGSTEHPTISGARNSDPPDLRKYTDGGLLDGVEVRIVDDDGLDVAEGRAGEVLSRGPELFVGYTDPALTRIAVDADGWYHTEDLGTLDGRGSLTITDRKKDIIIRGGENISASEVETLLLRMPGISEAAVVAAPDVRLGEHACAFVSMIPGNAPPVLDDVRTHLERAGLARQKWPEELRVVDDYPRTPSGKVTKYVLRDQLRREFAEGTAE
jgi:acyl-CoA synthetase (AMP-forming)/AMP-acid ligase II